MLTIVTRFTLSTRGATRITRSMKGESESHELPRISHWRAGKAATIRNTNQGKERCPMANVVKKYSISYELAQKMVDAAVAKARELGVAENVAILDDGGNLKAFSRMDGAPLPTTEMAQNKAYTALFGFSTQEFFNFIQSDPSLLAGIPALARMAAWGVGLSIKVNGVGVGGVGLG